MVDPLALAMMVVYVLVAGVIGAGVHELTHYLVAWAHGWPREIDFRELETYVRPCRPVADWEVALFAGAPLGVGLLVLPVLVLNPSVPVLVGWGIYTLGGVRNDVALAVTGADALAAGQALHSGSTPEAAVSGRGD